MALEELEQVGLLVGRERGRQLPFIGGKQSNCQNERRCACEPGGYAFHFHSSGLDRSVERIECDIRRRVK
jgi:hypothetical protein